MNNWLIRRNLSHFKNKIIINIGEQVRFFNNSKGSLVLVQVNFMKIGSTTNDNYIVDLDNVNSSLGLLPHL